MHRAGLLSLVPEHPSVQATCTLSTRPTLCFGGLSFTTATDCPELSGEFSAQANSPKLMAVGLLRMSLHLDAVA
jgi:hypothetical protein